MTARLSLALLSLALWSARASAQSCPPSDPTKPSLCRNNFAIDLYQGPVLAPLRVTALGGAYAALADGVEGLGQNAAAAAVRPPYSANTFDYDLSLSFYLPGAFGGTDFDNRGEEGLNSFTFFYSLGALAQWGPWGIGILGDFQRYTLQPQANSSLPSTVIEIGRLHLSTGYNILDDQVTVGGGVRGVRATLSTLQAGTSLNNLFLLTSTNLLTMTGVSPELGLVIHPDYAPWRLGMTYRFPVNAAATQDATVVTDAAGIRRAAGLALPDQVHWPGELEIGLALSAGPRPLNPRWIDPRQHEAQARRATAENRLARQRARALELASIEDRDARLAREEEFARSERYEQAEEEARLRSLRKRLEEERRARYKNWPRAHILVLVDALITGSTTDGIGLQSFLRQEDIPSGVSTSIQPRLGLEGEPVPERMVMRVGTYLEPSRYRSPQGSGILTGMRQHFTFGIEVRAVSWNFFGIARETPLTLHLAGDLAPRYQNLGLSIGTWH